MGMPLSSSTTNPLYNDVPINEAPFLYNKDLGYWDSRMGALNDSDRRIIWLSYTILRLLSTLMIGFVFVAILSNKKIRRKPYNLFLIYLMIPDLVYNIPGGIVYFLNYLAGKHISVASCKVESFCTVFGLSGNCWINALIACELYRMLQESYIRKHYYPPSVRVVSIRCIAAYLFCATLATIGAVNFAKLPYKTILQIGGTACLPAPYDLTSLLVFNLIISPFLIYIPFGMVIYIAVTITRRGYLPKKGEAKRVLTIFFFRLLLVYILFWMPGGTLVMLSTNPWYALAGGFLAQCQGAASAIAMLGKADILECVLDLTNWFRKKKSSSSSSCTQSSSTPITTTTTVSDSFTTGAPYRSSQKNSSSIKISNFVDDLDEEQQDQPESRIL